MIKFIIYRRSAIVLFLISCCFFLLIQCINNSNEKKANTIRTDILNTKNVNYQQFTGSEKCMSCHKEIYDSFIGTSHYHTSLPASEKYIRGNFEPGKNIFPFHPGLYVQMEKRDSGLFQAAYSNGVEKIAKRFDIITGSGAKGQTYLTWYKNELFQLPISYLTSANEWANSPGYPNKIVFNRSVTSRCLECHSTYVDVISAPGKEPEEFNHNEILYGVECEKCHGPGAEHVDYETQHPQDKQGKYIINTASLSRQQNLDLCALCHGGRLQKTKPSFEFIAGDSLSNFFVKNTSAPNTKEIDVHGNQFGLLAESKCFRNSASMTCSTCHDSHANERGKEALFSQRCMTCHNKEHGSFCKIDASKVSSITSNCIDCHMPKQQSMSVALLLPGDMVPTAALIHTHDIAVYPEETRKFIQEKNKSVKSH
jgi:hypothetical protein